MPCDEPDLCNDYILNDLVYIDCFCIKFPCHCVLKQIHLDTNLLINVVLRKKVVQSTKKPSVCPCNDQLVISPLLYIGISCLKTIVSLHGDRITLYHLVVDLLSQHQSWSVDLFKMMWTNILQILSGFNYYILKIIKHCEFTGAN